MRTIKFIIAGTGQIEFLVDSYHNRWHKDEPPYELIMNWSTTNSTPKIDTRKWYCPCSKEEYEVCYYDGKDPGKQPFYMRMREWAARCNGFIDVPGLIELRRATRTTLTATYRLPNSKYGQI